MIRPDQQERVRNYIRLGIEEGARLVTGGPQIPEGLEKGNYVTPTVFADVDTSMRIAQEEIFGPVLVVIAYDDEDDAVRIANDSEYGLSGGVWSADEEHALAVARRVRTGTITVNGASVAFDGPFGGFKASGIGREYGAVGLGTYTEYKTITVSIPVVRRGPRTTDVRRASPGRCGPRRAGGGPTATGAPRGHRTPAGRPGVRRTRTRSPRATGRPAPRAGRPSAGRRRRRPCRAGGATGVPRPPRRP
ncbi:hypothetical protein GCM10020295_02470 [Streptomyces cinereospinus]